MSTLRVNTLQNTSGVEVYTAKAWVNFNGTGTVAIRAAGNVSSITDNGVGDYTANFTTAMVDANYVLAGTAQRDVAAGQPLTAFLALRVGGNTTGSVRVQCQQSEANNFLDSQQMQIVIFR